jgi:hypothetical protein
MFALIAIGWFIPSLLHLGITLYGIIYFIVHDGLIHQRYYFWNNKISNTYLKQIQRHHIHPNKSPSKEFGLFLILGRKYWRDIFTQLNWFYNIKINTYIFF